ncbi:MAG: M3 family oligoendopeptidase [Tumebacillaceae bacterium]
MTMKTPLQLTWDLDAIYPGGSESEEFANFLEELDADVQAYAARMNGLEEEQLDAAGWDELLAITQNINMRVRNAFAFASCLVSQNVKDQKAKLLQGRIQQLSALSQSAQTKLDKAIMAVPADRWQSLLQDDRLAPLAFNLEERRRRASEKLAPEMEALIGNLSVDGYHAWGSLYNTVIGRMTIPYEHNGELKQLSVGQAQNMMRHPDAAVRAGVFAKWEEAFADNAELISASLNHLAGFRLQTYKARGWESVHQEPLDINRMSQETLDVMWDVIDRNKEPFVQYLNRKAKLLGLEKLSWCDYYAPIGSASSQMSYDEGAAFIVEQFAKFSPKLADFTVKAFEKSWIEAEDRAGKRPGGFCTSFPVEKESRIFMTYDRSPGGVATLAHELGHAYHQSVMNDLPYMVQGYAMNVAETASTFAELIVSDAALQNAQSEEERLALLDNKLQNAVAFFMDIQSRFTFETNFYAERKKGPVAAERLNELMVEAQQQAFRGALDQYHPHFWASKLHFHSTGVPFYNFPYTFGYLFSAGVYARALQEGEGFEDKYIDLLRDTGRMQVEDLAMKHLGVDLTKPEFWQSAVDLALADAEEFLKMTEGK